VEFRSPTTKTILWNEGLISMNRFRRSILISDKKGNCITETKRKPVSMTETACDIVIRREPRQLVPVARTRLIVPDEVC